ncbi:MAG: class I SAM-dependent RNA methyltransferase [Pseudomonadota bacterium]
MDSYDIFLVAPPGLEHLVAAEARDCGFAGLTQVPGGVSVNGPLSDVVRANRALRGPARVLLRIASFRAMHLAQLDKRSRKVDWAAILPQGTAIDVEASCRKSKIYHNKAAAQRVGIAAAEAIAGCVDPDATVRLKVRIEDDMVTISVDTSGDALHKRGHKGAMGKAPIRENLAALSLAACGFDPDTPLVDPMCGSGTFPIEAAEIAANLTPGRSRRFAFDDLAIDVPPLDDPNPVAGTARYFGFDRDQGAVKSATDNAAQAGVTALTQFACQPLSALEPPTDQPGLIMINPPYGGRIGNKKQLYGLYGAFGQIVKDRFAGWGVGLVTSEPSLAKATGLDWGDPVGPFPNGGLRVTLYRMGV